MTENKTIASGGTSIVLYTTKDGTTQLVVNLVKDTIY